MVREHHSLTWFVSIYTMLYYHMLESMSHATCKMYSQRKNHRLPRQVWSDRAIHRAPKKPGLSLALNSRGPSAHYHLGREAFCTKFFVSKADETLQPKVPNRLLLRDHRRRHYRWVACSGKVVGPLTASLMMMQKPFRSHMDVTFTDHVVVVCSRHILLHPSQHPVVQNSASQVLRRATRQVLTQTQRKQPKGDPSPKPCLRTNDRRARGTWLCHCLRIVVRERASEN